LWQTARNDDVAAAFLRNGSIIVNMTDWNRHVQTAQDTLRVLAEQTGGFAIVNQNSFEQGLKRINAETSDSYVVGYYASNPDPLKRRRAIEIKVKRPRLDVRHRPEYFLRPGRLRSLHCQDCQDHQNWRCGVRGHVPGCWRC
jgi:hypothetical protein